MGQDELVLRVSGGPSSAAHSPSPGEANSPAGTNGSAPSTSGKTRLTHSRESSGASVKVRLPMTTTTYYADVQ